MNVYDIKRFQALVVRGHVSSWANGTLVEARQLAKPLQTDPTWGSHARRMMLAVIEEMKKRGL